MGWLFEPWRGDACCLCGATENLTGEHKVKASLLRGEFGADPMTIGTNDGQYRSARGPKSKAFHFRSPMCATCNNARTHAADVAFDQFHALVKKAVAAGGEPRDALADSAFQKGSPGYDGLFRYFAKLLCAHMAEAEAPRPVPIARYAMGEAEYNPILLAVGRDWTYRNGVEILGEHYQYAAHGGLVVLGDKDTGAVSGFHSTLTVGPIRYVFRCRLNKIGAVALDLFHRRFANACRATIKAAVAEPLSQTQLLQLGLTAEDETQPASDAI